MSKRNITYVKPEEPKFLRLLKEQVGYNDRNPKFDELENNPDDFEDDNESEQPQVVVLKAGDLTAEEAAQAKEDLEKAALEAKADLNQKVIFTSRKTKKEEEPNTGTKRKSYNNGTSKESKKRSKSDNKTSTLSFNIEDEDEET